MFHKKSMFRLRRNLFLVLSLFINGSYTRDVQSPFEIKTLLCVGDSITKGSGASKSSHDYPSQLSHLLNENTRHNGVHYDVINLGKGIHHRIIDYLSPRYYYNSGRIRQCNNAESSRNVILEICTICYGITF